VVPEECLEESRVCADYPADFFRDLQMVHNVLLEHRALVLVELLYFLRGEYVSHGFISLEYELPVELLIVESALIQ
jgi:hypothetical protein